MTSPFSAFQVGQDHGEHRKEEEEEEDLFVFNDTTEGPRAPAVKPGRVAQEEEEEEEEEEEKSSITHVQ